VHAKDLFVYDSSDGEAVETLGKGLPQFDTVPPFTFVVEAVYSVYGGAFMVASEDEEVFLGT